MAFDDPFFVSLYEQFDGRRTVDRDFYLGEANKTSGRILDLGCGSGRLLIPMMKLGREVVGVDYSIEMLDVLRSSASAQAISPILIQSRFEHLDIALLPGRQQSYSLIVCAFNSFLHLMDQQSQIVFLKKVRSLLTPAGKFIVDLVNPCSHEMFMTAETEREHEHKFFDQATGERIESWLTIKNNLLQQTGELQRDYEIISGEGEVEKRVSIVSYRWIYPEEMRLLLTIAGFSDLAVFGDFNYGPLTVESECQAWIAG
jgi:SAM-dependent methyltransferase